jgi:glycine/D-amino acid oxidase-like deaminating enzyme
MAPIVRRWAGVVGYTESGLPVFEEVRPGVWAIGGYCGTGNVIGAICGRAAARMVATGRCEDRELFTS